MLIQQRPQGTLRDLELGWPFSVPELEQGSQAFNNKSFIAGEPLIIYSVST